MCNTTHSYNRNINETITPGKKQEKQNILNLSEGKLPILLTIPLHINFNLPITHSHIL